MRAFWDNIRPWFLRSMMVSAAMIVAWILFFQGYVHIASVAGALTWYGNRNAAKETKRYDADSPWTVANVLCPNILIKRGKGTNAEQRLVEYPPSGYGTARYRITQALDNQKVLRATVEYCKEHVRPGWIVVYNEGEDDWGFFPPAKLTDCANGTNACASPPPAAPPAE